MSAGLPAGALEALLEDGLTGLGLALPPDRRKRLLEFAAMLSKWNKVYNLTAIREPMDVITHHLLDSLAVLPYLDGVGTLADVGSGGGLPGIPLAIARPELQVRSIETVGKKASFQQQVKIELGLGNFAVSASRVESVSVPGGFDVVISRAFSSIADFVRLAGHLVGSGGALFAMKGVLPADELASLPAAWALMATRVLEVPGLDAERHLLEIRRA